MEKAEIAPVRATSACRPEGDDKVWEGQSGACLTKEIQELEIQDQKKYEGCILESNNMNDPRHRKLIAKGREGTLAKLDSCFYPDSYEQL